MTLAALIRKRETQMPANDNPAKAANDEQARSEPLAGLATLALANPRGTKGPTTAEEEAAIRAWLAHIEETDPDAIAEVLEKCERDIEARTFFCGGQRKTYLPKFDVRSNDDRRTCRQCLNLTRRGLCLAARRGEIAEIRNYEPSRDFPRRCEGYAPGPDDPDRRTGRERWLVLGQEIRP